MKSSKRTGSSATLHAKDVSLDWAYDQGVADRVLEKMQANLKQKNRHRRRVATGAACLAVALLGIFYGIPTIRDTNNVNVPAATRQELTLADGSRLDLNAQTKLHTDFRYGRRIVRLDSGEAFFAVTKDPAHPFFVETPAGTVRVTGTQFNVRLSQGNGAEVTLAEGSVLIENKNTEPVSLRPNQQASFDLNTSSVRVLSEDDMESTLAWRQGTLMLDGLTLAEAAARMASYHGCTIEVAPGVAALTPGGSVPLGDLRAFLGAIQAALPVRVLAGQDGTYRLVPR